ncbi:MAG: dihydrolipoamide dehydrogenase [Candidatus Harrisonbacteria bacterium CG10_big_fil_rev_8_21_14_0_10_42_17]|uniref:Dihydrolipoamide dehydrogenase n=1 Tax=Candidatus Harrisonbacteria bacterium CG10_big_fil_rev_8_21_14_0_10_42_17 TaxID=1974584 RepID=A0A2M6WHX9_9BACT|nr:MAG: dihydrolipoamide dehydrogenase [Candidatus Harrisonbacteria bacterium CG10_big_fil_rev_8_21_14_0_10_42_17]
MNNNENQYDLIVIGAGSGLNVAAYTAATYDWNVAIIEKGPMGGTCLNRGCIPSKIIIHAADVAEGIKNAKRFGIDATINNIDFEFVTKRASEFVDKEAVEIEENIEKSENITLYKGTGEFTSNKSIKVNGKTITGKRILIAAGTRPFIPPIPGIEETGYITSTEALRLTKQPKSVIIIGGGYISAELGHFLGALGTNVTIIQNGSLLINREDGEIAKTFTEIWKKKYTVILDAKTKNIGTKNNIKTVTIENKDGSETILEAEEILVTTGRKSNSDLLKLENTEIKTNERGFIEVNEYMETNIEGVWALGDIVGRAPFKHGANWEAEHVVHNINEKNNSQAVDYSIMPHAIFTSPQIAGVGLTEEQAKEKNIDHVIKKTAYIESGMGKALEEHDGFVKFILSGDGKKILGCHIMGPEASILIHEIIVALKGAGGDVKAITRAIHIHPALNEIVQHAILRG